MVTVRLEKFDDHYFVKIPSDIVERYQLAEGQVIALEITPLIDGRPVLRPELREALEESLERDGEAYRYLADR